jgi:hypothetical protein
MIAIFWIAEKPAWEPWTVIGIAGCPNGVEVSWPFCLAFRLHHARPWANPPSDDGASAENPDAAASSAMRCDISSAGLSAIFRV